MPARYTILKKTRTQVNVKVVGQGSVTIPFTDMKLADETLATPAVSIVAANWSVHQDLGVVVISRGSNITQYLYSSDDWRLAQENGVSDTEYTTDALTIDIQGSNGTVFVMLHKLSGFVEPNTQ